MDISVPSRFSVLRIDGDDNRPKKSVTNKPKPKNADQKSSATKKNAQAANSKQSSKKSGKNNPNKVTEKQWEEWKKKDSVTVNDNFEQDLQDAILLSKIDFETNKGGDSVIKTEDKIRASSNNAKKNKKGKSTMSLDEYLKNGDDQAQDTNQAGGVVEAEEQDDRFFEKMLELSKKEVTKSKVEEERKEREFNIDQVIGIAQYQEKLKAERERNASLQKELNDAKAEVVAVKARNKMLCTILGHGEMRDKAEILTELERLNTVKDELTEEVSHLHKLLEKERSNKIVASSDVPVKHKDKNRK